MQPGPGSYYPEQSKRDLHVNEVVGKASKRLHILHQCFQERIKL